MAFSFFLYEYLISPLLTAEVSQAFDTKVLIMCGGFVLINGALIAIFKYAKKSNLPASVLWMCVWSTAWSIKAALEAYNTISWVVVGTHLVWNSFGLGWWRWRRRSGSAKAEVESISWMLLTFGSVAELTLSSPHFKSFDTWMPVYYAVVFALENLMGTLVEEWEKPEYVKEGEKKFKGLVDEFSLKKGEAEALRIAFNERLKKMSDTVTMVVAAETAVEAAEASKELAEVAAAAAAKASEMATATATATEDSV